MGRKIKNLEQQNNNIGLLFQYTLNQLSFHPPMVNSTRTELLLQIRLKKESFAKTPKEKKNCIVYPVKDAQQPFRIPDHWCWLKIGDVIELVPNKNIHKELEPDTPIHYVDIASIDNSSFTIGVLDTTPVSKLSSRARRVLKKGDFLYSLVRPYLNNMAIVQESKANMIGSTGFVVFNGICMTNEYIQLWLQTDFIRNYYLEMLSGFNSPSISSSQFNDTPIPIPPLDEQNEIVNFIKALKTDAVLVSNSIPSEIVDKLMKLTEIQALSKQLNSTIQERQPLLADLKNTFLQDIIQGKLTKEWRIENRDLESGAVILTNTKAEKTQLIKDKVIKKEKPLPSITKEKIPFELPKGWAWCILDEIALFKNGKAHEQFVDSNGQYILINSKFVSTNGGTKKHTSKQMMAMYENEIAIVMSDVPNGRALSRCFLVDKNDKYSLNQRIGGIIPLKGILPEYLRIALDRNTHYLSFNDGKKQTNLKKDQILSCPIPIPPIEEQQAIVKKVENLMQKCQALEEEIKSSEANAQLLMQAVLKEAFEGKKEEVEA